MEKDKKVTKKSNDIVMIPFVAHESAMNRVYNIIKMLVAIIVVMIIGATVYLVIPNEVVEEDTTTSQEVSEVNDSEIHQTIGD